MYNAFVAGLLRERDLVSLISHDASAKKPLVVCEDMCHVVYMHASSEKIIAYISDYGDGSLTLGTCYVDGYDFIRSNLYMHSYCKCPDCYNDSVNFTLALRDFDCESCGFGGDIPFSSKSELTFMFKDVSIFRLNPRWRWAGNVK